MKRSRSLGLLLLALSLLALPACDSNDDEDDSDFAAFARGSWEITELRIEGSDLTAQLDARYDSHVIFSFNENASTNERTFGIFADFEDGENLDEGGEVDIDGGEDVLFFQPTTGAPNFELEYDLESSSRIFLFADENNGSDGRIIRNLLLPNAALGGSFPTVEITIERQSLSSN